MGVLRKYSLQIITGLVASLLASAATFFLPRLAGYLSRIPPQIVRTYVLLAAAVASLVGILVFAFVYLARRRREPSLIVYCLAGAFSIIAAGVLSSVILLAVQLRSEDFPIPLVSDGRSLTLWCARYETNGHVLFDKKQAQSGEDWLWITPRRVNPDPPVENREAIVPFDCGVMLRCRSGWLFDISEGGLLEFKLQLEVVDTIDELYFGLADRDKDWEGTEVKYCLADFAGEPHLDGETCYYLIQVPLTRFRALNCRRVHMIVFSTNSEIIGEDGRVAFGLKEIRVEK